MGTRTGVLVFLLVAVLLSVGVRGQEGTAGAKPLAAVMDLQAQTGIDQRTANLLSDTLRSSLHKTGEYELLTRENVSDALKEQKLQMSDCTSQECVVKTGRILGAHKMFAGSIGKVGATYVVTVKLFSVETGRIEKIEDDRCADCREDALLDSVDRVAARLCGKEVATGTARPSGTAASVRGKEITGKDGAVMVLIPAGEYWMGSPEGEGDSDEHPRHKVFVDAFYLDKYEVTVAQYRKFCSGTGRSMPAAPSWGWQDNHPMVNVSWEDAAAYAAWAGKRLPTEAEWEYACRAGSTTKYCYGDAEGLLGEYGWYASNSGRQSHPVGQKKPNAWGLYDMHGNVWEWCWDWYDENYYRNSPERNPQGPGSGTARVVRGGSWDNTPVVCRSAYRCRDRPSDAFDSLGFRCAASVSVP